MNTQLDKPEEGYDIDTTKTLDRQVSRVLNKFRGRCEEELTTEEYLDLIDMTTDYILLLAENYFKNQTKPKGEKKDVKKQAENKGKK